MIDTIFYYPQSLSFDDYRTQLENEEISPDTIVFAHDQKAIYKGGEKYGVTGVNDLNTNELNDKVYEIIRENPYILPVASSFMLGGVMVGDFLNINPTTGRLDVNVSEILSSVDTITTVKNIINPAYILQNQEKLQPATNSRLGGIIKGNYLSIDETGRLDVNLTSVISAIRTDASFIGFLNSRAYTLPTASNGVKGGIKIGEGLSMSGEVLSLNMRYVNSNVEQPGLTNIPAATSEALGGIKLYDAETSLSGKNYVLKLDENNRAYVSVPWESGQQ